jgi:hypothetical protein
MIITVKKVPFNDAAIATTIGPIVFVEKGAVDKGVIEAYRLWEETRAYGIQAAVNNYSTEKTKSYAKILLDHYTKGDYSQADITDLEEKLIDERANYS